MAVKENQFTLPVDLTRTAGRPLRSQLEGQLRGAVRDGRLPPRTRLPSTRSLALSLGVSRGVVVEAYAQLVAEGYLTARRGDGTRVSAGAVPSRPPAPAPPRERPPRYDLRLGVPDVTAFPRREWLASTRRVLRELPDPRLGHPDPRGAPELRQALAEYLARVRGVTATPERIVVCTGFWQGLGLVCRTLRRQGGQRMAMEDPSFVAHRLLVGEAGFEPVPVGVDGDGLDVGKLRAGGADAVLVTPAHQFPTGVVLAPERRHALLEWADETGALVVEDDYDAEYRYDREPVGALQGLAPERVIYGGTASKTLSPALRLGWLVLPESLAADVGAAKALADGGTGVLEQLVYADFLQRGELDRHLRRTRLSYRRRRDRLAEALSAQLPEARLGGVAAGLHAVIELPPDCDEARVVKLATARGVAVEGAALHRFTPGGGPALLAGYARLSEPAIPRAVRELAAAVHEARQRC